MHASFVQMFVCNFVDSVSFIGFIVTHMLGLKAFDNFNAIETLTKTTCQWIGFMTLMAMRMLYILTFCFVLTYVSCLLQW